MTSKNLEKLYDLHSELINLRSALTEQLLIKSRSGALVLTKLDEARFWLHDLIKEVGDREDLDACRASTRNAISDEELIKL